MRAKITFWAIALAGIFTVDYSGLAQEVFTISTEPRPAQFYRYNPKLYHRHDDSFMLAWIDFRDGIEGVYAQYFDSAGRPLGGNFKIFANELVAFGPEEEFLMVRHESNIYHLALAQLYGPSGPIKGRIELTRFHIPTDYFGCPAFGSFLGSIPSGYLFTDVFFGAIKIMALDFKLNQTHNVPAENLPMDARGFAMASTSDGAYVLYWFGSYVEFSKNTQLYGKFFNKNHEILADSVFLGNKWNTCDAVSPMQAVTLQDSLYQLFFTTEDTLWYLACDRKGNIVQPVDYVVVRRPTGVPPLSARRAAFGISNVFNGTFFLIFKQLYSWQENDEYKQFNHTSLHEFGVDGQPQGEPVLSYPPYQITGNVHRQNQDHFQAPLAIDNDIFLDDFNRNLSLLDSIQVNADSLGANQRNPLSIPAPNEKFLVLWEDETSKRARMIGADGSLIGSEFVPLITHGQFLPTHEFLTTWISRENDAYAAGYRIYSPNWQVVEDRKLAKRTGFVQWVNLSTQVVDNDSFLAFLQDSTELRLLSISRLNGILKDTLVAKDIEGHLRLRMASDGNGIFWVLWQSINTNTTYMRAYDINFNTRSALIANRAVDVEGVQFQPEGRYGFLQRDSQSGVNFLVVKDANQDEPIKSAQIGGTTSHSFQLQILDKRYFLAKWVENHEIFLQAFDRNGLPVKEPLAVYASPSSSLMGTSLVTNGSNALLSWADITTPGHGYDIMGRILHTSIIVNVEAPVKQITEFSLKQNFPNPFNVGTMIRIEISSKLANQQARLAIYNLRGELVRELLNRRLPAGTHFARWEGRNDAGGEVVSGIYFCRLQVGNVTEMRKLILRK